MHAADALDDTARVATASATDFCRDVHDGTASHGHKNATYLISSNSLKSLLNAAL